MSLWHLNVAVGKADIMWHTCADSIHTKASQATARVRGARQGKGSVRGASGCVGADSAEATR